MGNESSENHGEGNPEAAERFNEAEQQFIKSPRGQQKIKEGPQVRPEEQAELERAERIGREHIKAEDPEVHRDRS
jgi:hypothetical protein